MNIFTDYQHPIRTTAITIGVFLWFMGGLFFFLLQFSSNTDLEKSFYQYQCKEEMGFKP